MQEDREWKSVVYQGLSDLQIDVDDISISRPQLANILTACPALTTLKLSHLRIKNTNEWNQPPILMQHLEFVNLVCMESRDVSSVLSTITLPGPRAELGIKDSPGGALDRELVGFFGRSKVTTLYYTCHPCEGDCDGCINNRGCEGGSSKALQLFTQHLPHAQTFILHKVTLNLLRVNRASTLQALSTPLQPWLPKLVLLEYTVNFEALKRLVLETNIQELRLEQCTAAHHPAPDPQQQELKTIRASLQETYPHLQCWISDIDSTKRLACRTMFYSD
ncbi:hypothetical protein FRC12_010868 [Ceratobasidium sp. 428]|nr:hypothetical protein FRC12_010868 [Ceratobasidium sp. 428]